jgi:sodium-independent sulfate anion transporter 11
LGFLVQFISQPTIIAFTTSATITIASGQVKPLLGIKSGSSNEFIEAWMNIFEHLDEIKFEDTIFGIISIALLLILKKPTWIAKKFPIFAKYLSISRNAIIVIIGIVTAYIFHINNLKPFNLTGEIEKGLPSFKFPPTSTELDDKEYQFMDMVRALGLSLITLPLVSILESIGIAK